MGGGAIPPTRNADRPLSIRSSESDGEHRILRRRRPYPRHLLLYMLRYLVGRPYKVINESSRRSPGTLHRQLKPKVQALHKVTTRGPETQIPRHQFWFYWS